MSTPQLTPKQRKFVTEYLKDGNATDAAIRAGYSKRTARSIGHENLTKPDIAKLIEARVVLQEEKGIATADERDLVLSEIMRNRWLDTKDRIKAIAELNKCSGRHSSTVNVKGKLTLEEALSMANDALDAPEKR